MLYDSGAFMCLFTGIVSCTGTHWITYKQKNSVVPTFPIVFWHLNCVVHRDGQKSRMPGQLNILIEVMMIGIANTSIRKAPTIGTTR